ncbi:MAG: M23 family metallopeptidase [Chloroflexota bacterium]
MARSSWAAGVLLLALLAGCNYPGRPQPYGPQGQALKQTLDAAVQAGTPGLPGRATTSPGDPAPQPGYTPGAAPTGAPAASANPPALGGTPPPAGDPDWLDYTTQSGDSLPALLLRFGVQAQDIDPYRDLPPQGMLPPGMPLRLRRAALNPAAAAALSGMWVLPDSEVVNSPTALDFDVSAFIQQANGALNRYSERVGQETLSGAQIVERVAVESSVNPRLLLAWIELRSGWVSGAHAPPRSPRYPLGFAIANWEGLYKELVISATHLNAGYYGWRDGSLLELALADGSRRRLAPTLNAGTVGLANLLARVYPTQAEWLAALSSEDGIAAAYTALFGDAWARAQALGPLLPAGLAQPQLALPFPPGERWSLTGGPHPSWKTGSPRGAIDFAPVTGEPACAVSRAWALAAADGVIARSERNVVALDLDGDGREQTGWVLVYLHLADRERAVDGLAVRVDDRLGHPSCEGGQVTGTHVHLARKYNGEWLAVQGLAPFVLGGWEVFAGEKTYQGELRRAGQVVVASPVGPATSIIVR